MVLNWCRTLGQRSTLTGAFGGLHESDNVVFLLETITFLNRVLQGCDRRLSAVVQPSCNVTFSIHFYCDRCNIKYSVAQSFSPFLVSPSFSRHLFTHTILEGFRLDPPEQLTRVHQELSSLHKVHAADPIFGVDYEEEKNVSTDK